MQNLLLFPYAQGCASAIEQIGGGFIGHMDDPGQREGLVSAAGFPDRVPAGGGAHMAVDRGSLIGLQLHELLDEEDRLGTVPAETVFFLNGVAGDSLPCIADFLIPEILFIEILSAMYRRFSDSGNPLYRNSPCRDRGRVRK